MTIDAGSGNVREGFLWTATDLKEFPLQIQIDDPRMKMTMRFKDVQLKEPDAGRFIPPADFTKYTNPQEMMQAVAQKMMGSGGMPGMAPPR